MGKQVEETNTSLLNFDWENDEVDFFGVSNVTGEATTTEKKKESAKPKEGEEAEEEETQETSSSEENQEQEEVFFNEEESEESESEEEEEEQSSSSENSDNYWKDVYKDFKENGILKHVEIEEGEEVDSEKLFELQQQDYEAEVDARLKNWAKEELDEDAQAFIKFKRNGGSTAEFLRIYSSSSEIPTGDIKEEEYQDKVIRYQLKQEGWDSDEIEDRIQYLTENGKKESVAKRYDKKVKEADKQNKKALQEQAIRQREAVAEQEREFKENIKGVLEETKEVNGFKITPKDKTELYNFLTKKNHKISDTKSITGFQKKLGEAFQDTNKMILLAKLISSDFDLSQFEKQTITKKTKQIKSNLEQRKNLRPSKSGSSSQGSSLADLFN